MLHLILASISETNECLDQLGLINRVALTYHHRFDVFDMGSEPLQCSLDRGDQHHGALVFV